MPAAKKKTTIKNRKRKPKATRPAANVTPPASFDSLLVVRPDDVGVLGLLPLLTKPQPIC